MNIFSCKALDVELSRLKRSNTHLESTSSALQNSLEAAMQKITSLETLLADTQDRWKEALVLQQSLETRAREESLKLLDGFEERAREMRERVERETGDIFRKRVEIVQAGRDEEVSKVVLLLHEIF